MIRSVVFLYILTQSLFIVQKDRNNGGLEKKINIKYGWDIHYQPCPSEVCYRRHHLIIFSVVIGTSARYTSY